MKITDVQLIYAKQCLLSHVYTGAGIAGLGRANSPEYLEANPICPALPINSANPTALLKDSGGIAI